MSRTHTFHVWGNIFTPQMMNTGIKQESHMENMTCKLFAVALQMGCTVLHLGGEVNNIFLTIIGEVYGRKNCIYKNRSKTKRETGT